MTSHQHVNIIPNQRILKSDLSFWKIVLNSASHLSLVEGDGLFYAR